MFLPQIILCYPYYLFFCVVLNSNLLCSWKVIYSKLLCCPTNGFKSRTIEIFYSVLYLLSSCLRKGMFLSEFICWRKNIFHCSEFLISRYDMAWLWNTEFHRICVEIFSIGIVGTFTSRWIHSYTLPWLNRIARVVMSRATS